MTSTRRKVNTDRYRLCLEGAGSSKVVCTCTTIEDVMAVIESDGQWVMVAQGVDGLRIDGFAIELRDRDMKWIDRWDRPKNYGIAREHVCRRSSLTSRNPAQED